MRFIRSMAQALVAGLLSGFAVLPLSAQEKVTFPSKDADVHNGSATTLTGYLYKPQGSGPFPAVVTTHGCNGLHEKDGLTPVHTHWGEELSQAGYVVLLVDSFGSRGHGDLCIAITTNKNPVPARRDGLRDVRGGLEYLQTRPDVVPSRIALLGQSYGGAVAFVTVGNAQEMRSADPTLDFRGLVVLYPPCKPFIGTTPQWKPRVPMLLLMRATDNYDPSGTCQMLDEKLKQEGVTHVQMHFYLDAVHAFDHPNLPIGPTLFKRPDGSQPMRGTHKEARLDALQRVKVFLGETLK